MSSACAVFVCARDVAGTWVAGICPGRFPRLARSPACPTRRVPSVSAPPRPPVLADRRTTSHPRRLRGKRIQGLLSIRRLMRRRPCRRRMGPVTRRRIPQQSARHAAERDGLRTRCGRQCHPDEPCLDAVEGLCCAPSVAAAPRGAPGSVPGANERPQDSCCSADTHSMWRRRDDGRLEGAWSRCLGGAVARLRGWPGPWRRAGVRPGRQACGRRELRGRMARLRRRSAGAGRSMPAPGARWLSECAPAG